jgi:hypothetical protein
MKHKKLKLPAGNPGVSSLKQFKEELQCHKCGKIPRSGPIFRTKELEICCESCNYECCHGKEHSDQLAEKLIASCLFLCRNHVNGCDIEELTIDVSINQRQSTLDCRYLTLLCDNLKKRKFLQNFFS